MNATKILTKTEAPDMLGNLLEEYQGRNFYGKVTIYLENGEVTSVRTEESLHPGNLKEKYGKPRKRFVVKSKAASEIKGDDSFVEKESSNIEEG